MHMDELANESIDVELKRIARANEELVLCFFRLELIERLRRRGGCFDEAQQKEQVEAVLKRGQYWTARLSAVLERQGKPAARIIEDLLEKHGGITRDELLAQMLGLRPKWSGT